ncbi:MAG: PilZ domain-containing protein [bacterium]|nr:PilZ domain-containing protein [bacterium]MDT8396506.1 PilZ domain-containing protein [bacterium]
MKWVLVIEASEMDREYLERVIGRLGYQIYSAISGEEAIHFMNQSLPHALVVGERIPDCDPLDLGRTIRKDRILSGPPMLLMSSRKDHLFNEKARQAGFAEIVHRPMSIRKFFTSLELCLSNNRRIYIRAPMAIPVLLRSAASKLSLTTHNFGEGGMYIQTVNPLPSGTEVDLDFNLPGLRNSFSFRSQVMHTQSRGTDELPAGMGLRFLDIKPAIETIFRIFMENFLAKRMAA